MRGAPAIYARYPGVIYGDNFHFDWLASAPVCGKRPALVGNACLETAHAKTVSNEGCASFAWVSHRDLNLANFVIIASWLCYITARLTLLDLYPSPSIIIILYSMKRLKAFPALFKCVC